MVEGTSHVEAVAVSGFAFDHVGQTIHDTCQGDGATSIAGSISSGTTRWIIGQTCKNENLTLNEKNLFKNV